MNYIQRKYTIIPLWITLGMNRIKAPASVEKANTILIVTKAFHQALSVDV